MHSGYDKIKLSIVVICNEVPNWKQGTGGQVERLAEG